MEGAGGLQEAVDLPLPDGENGGVSHVPRLCCVGFEIGRASRLELGFDVGDAAGIDAPGRGEDDARGRGDGGENVGEGREGARGEVAVC